MFLGGGGAKRVVCSGCGGQVQGGMEYVTLRDGAVCFHPQCFRCALCHGVIPANTAFTTDPKESTTSGRYYHTSCFHQIHSPECCVCHEKMLPNASGVIEYAVTPFWNQKFCRSHQRDGTRKCFACNRLESRAEPHVVLAESSSPGARSRPRGFTASSSALCLNCAESVVLTAEDVSHLYREMREFFVKLGASLPLDLPVHLVDPGALNERRQRCDTPDNDNGYHGAPHIHCMGLTLSEERTTVVRRAGGLGFGGSTEVVSKTSDVTAVLVLRGLPRLLFCSVLAHECGHAHFKLQGFHKMALKTEEGLCQLLAYLWLRQEGHCRAEGERERERLYHMNKIFEDSSEIYGAGFRAAFEAHERYGISRVLGHASLCGELPE